MTGPEGDRQRAVATSDFKRLMIYLVIAGVLMVTAALFYLAYFGELTTTLVVTVTAGVFVSIVLGGGLMAAGFFSSNSGHDEDVSEATTHPDAVAEPDSASSPALPHQHPDHNP